MRPWATETQVRVAFSGDVKIRPALEIVLVLIARAIPQYDFLAALEFLFAEHHTLAGNRPAHVQHGRGPPNYFLNRRLGVGVGI